MLSTDLEEELEVFNFVLLPIFLLFLFYLAGFLQFCIFSLL